jgi:hypothetical protein
MDELLGTLGDVAYPATKDELIAAAFAGGASEEALVRLKALDGDSYDNADQVGRALVRSRASSNPSLVAIVPEPCPECGFLKMPGEPHSCIEEKARFADSVQSVTDEFNTLDDRRR